MNLTDYLNLIPSQNREQPNFIATISTVIGAVIDVQNMIQSMVPKFDVDVAVGDQLDIIGRWVEISRNIAVPITGVYFSWDGTDFSLGWDFGSWQPSNAPADVTVLPDDAYRLLMKAKIAANSWDGTTEGAYAIWDSVFSTNSILIQDHQDMSYDLAIVGQQLDSLIVALITQGYLPLKPEAIRVNAYFIPIDSNPIFAWDSSSTVLAGWDTGSWAREITS